MDKTNRFDRLPSDILTYTKGIKGYRYIVTITSNFRLAHAIVLRADNKIQADEIINKWIKDHTANVLKEHDVKRLSIRFELQHERILTPKEQQIFDKMLEIAKRDEDGKFLGPNSPEWEELSAIKNEKS